MGEAETCLPYSLLAQSGSPYKAWVTLSSPWPFLQVGSVQSSPWYCALSLGVFMGWPLGVGEWEDQDWAEWARMALQLVVPIWGMWTGSSYLCIDQSLHEAAPGKGDMLLGEEVPVRQGQVPERNLVETYWPPHFQLLVDECSIPGVGNRGDAPFQPFEPRSCKGFLLLLVPECLSTSGFCFFIKFS